jgi:hypothetical protein
MYAPTKRKRGHPSGNFINLQKRASNPIETNAREPDKSADHLMHTDLLNRIQRMRNEKRRQ